MQPKDGLQQMEVCWISQCVYVSLSQCVCVTCFVFLSETSTYSVSKIGVNRLTELLAEKVAVDPSRPGVLVNGVSTHSVVECPSQHMWLEGYSTVVIPWCACVARDTVIVLSVC